LRMLKRFWPISWAQGLYSPKTIKEHTLTPVGRPPPTSPLVENLFSYTGIV
jgi:hypothetical protein